MWRTIAFLASVSGFHGADVSKPNFVVVLMDDVGTDRVSVYGDHPNPAITPVIDNLASQGLVFDVCYSNALCTPTRGSVHTGLMPSKTGVYGNVGAGFALTDDFPTIAGTLSEEGYITGLFGKWHLSNVNPDDPRLIGGFDEYAGGLNNLGIASQYMNFTKTVNGVQTEVTNTYATTDEVDDALDFVSSAPEPWLLMLSFHAAHSPFHDPPDHLHSYGDPIDTPTEHRAMIEALDTELGRFLGAVPDGTFVIVVGDNGSPKQTIDFPGIPEHGKGTMYELGVRVPMVVTGPGVEAGETQSLTHVTDIYATLLELSGSNSAVPADSVSFAPVLYDTDYDTGREILVAQRGSPTAQRWAARDQQYKMIRRRLEDDSVVVEFYDLVADPTETTDLLPGGLNGTQARALRDLSAAVSQFP